MGSAEMPWLLLPYGRRQKERIVYSFDLSSHQAIFLNGFFKDLDQKQHLYMLPAVLAANSTSAQRLVSFCSGCSGTGWLARHDPGHDGHGYDHHRHHAEDGKRAEGAGAGHLTRFPVSHKGTLPTAASVILTGPEPAGISAG